MRWRFVGPALTVGVLVLSSEARAQDAQALFDQGLEDMKAGRFKIGCALIKRSLDIDARAGTMFTLAECYSKAEKYASAVELYDHFLQLYAVMPSDQQAQQQARAELSFNERNRLVALVAWLTVALPQSAPPGVVVTRDGEAFPPNLFGVALAVDPGPHVFTTRAPDGPLIEQRVDVLGGERKTVALEVRSAVSNTPSLPPDPQDPEPDAAPTSGGPSPWVYVAGGVGATGLITGGITGVLLLEKRRTILDECPSRRCTAAGFEAVKTAQNTLAPVTTVALGVGAAGTLTAVLLLVTGAGSSSRTPSPSVSVRAGVTTFELFSAW